MKALDYENFLKDAELFSPELFSRKRIDKPLYNEDNAIIAYNLAVGYTVKEIIDKVEDELKMGILYWHKSPLYTGVKETFCIYTAPKGKMLFKVNGWGDEGEKVKEITCTVYDSLDSFYEGLYDDMAVHSRYGKFNYVRELNEVQLDFFRLW